MDSVLTLAPGCAAAEDDGESDDEEVEEAYNARKASKKEKKKQEREEQRQVGYEIMMACSAIFFLCLQPATNYYDW